MKQVYRLWLKDSKIHSMIVLDHEIENLPTAIVDCISRVERLFNELGC
jgi:hypothetical protein